jgi:putative ABC transport system ATP-binding protein
LPAVLAGLSRDEADQRARETLTRVGLEHRMSHKPLEMSGGQQQRTAIARALVNRPTILLADEPTANLDFATGEEIIALLGELSRELGVTVITATHDHKMLKASDRIVWIVDGAVSRIENAGDIVIEAGHIEGAPSASHGPSDAKK